MKTPSLCILFTLLTAVLITPLLQAQEELVFQERFMNLTGANAGFNSIGWTAIVKDPEGTGSDAPVDVSSIDGQPSATLGGVSGDIGYEICFCDDDGGLVFLWTGGKTTWWALTYDGFTLDRSEMEITRVTFQNDMSHDAVHETRFMVKIGGQWYATATAYTQTDGELKVFEAVEHMFTTDGADWLEVTAEVGVDVALGDPVSGSLPAGDIEAIGFFFMHPPTMSSIRFDEVEIYAEPAEGGGNGGNGGGDETWNGFPVVEGIAYTENFLGAINVAGDPWVFIFDLNVWGYIPEVADTGAWVWISK